MSISALRTWPGCAEYTAAGCFSGWRRGANPIVPAMSVHTPTESSRPDGFALTIFVMLVLVWGLLWPAMKVATDEISILTFRAAGSLMAVIAMLIITVIAGHSLKVPKRQDGPAGHWRPVQRWCLALPVCSRRDHDRRGPCLTDSLYDAGLGLL